jgi:DNA invertase Pin-like site-specific DNA recombinase
MKKAIIYARFSPRRNAETSESNEQQIEHCQAYCQSKGYCVAAVHQDIAQSGKDADRAGLWAAVESLKSGMILVVYRYDRLARDTFLSEYIFREVGKRSATIETVQGGTAATPEGDLLRRVLQAFAQYEREIISIRTSLAMRRHQAQGKVMGGVPPFGYQIDPKNSKRLIVNPHEQDALKRMIVLHNEGESTRQIARRLSEEGFTPRGKQWYHHTVYRLLTSH